MEEKLSKRITKKLKYTIDPEIIKPDLEDNVVSKTENVPVKKESFAEKLNRIKSDGNTAAIKLTVYDIHFNVERQSNPVPSLEKFIPFKEKDALQSIGKHLATQLNETYSTDNLIELVDFDKLPYQTDANDTKYKLLLKLTVVPTYTIEINFDDSGYDIEYVFRTKLTLEAHEYYRENGQSKFSYVLMSPFYFNDYKVSVKEKDMSSEPKIISQMAKTINESIDRKRGEEFVAEIEKLIDEKYLKLIKRLD